MLEGTFSFTLENYKDLKFKGSSISSEFLYFLRKFFSFFSIFFSDSVYSSKNSNSFLLSAIQQRDTTRFTNIMSTRKIVIY